MNKTIRSLSTTALDFNQNSKNFPHFAFIAPIDHDNRLKYIHEYLQTHKSGHAKLEDHLYFCEYFKVDYDDSTDLYDVYVMNKNNLIHTRQGIDKSVSLTTHVLNQARNPR